MQDTMQNDQPGHHGGMASYQEIMNQIEALKVEAEAARKRELAGAIAEIKRMMAKHHITPADLGIPDRAPKNRIRGTAKYRDPASGRTWSGRGRRPAWAVAWEDAGNSLDACKI